MSRIAFVFPGQGSQYVGMGKKICEEYSVARNIFEEASDALGFDLYKLCISGEKDELTDTVNAQPAILTLSTAMFKVYMQEIGIRPIISSGHSLGEISALSCAGAINVSDAVKLVRKRGEFMKEAADARDGGMLSIMGCDAASLEEICRDISNGENRISISNYNSRDQIVVSGDRSALVQLEERIKDIATKVVYLNVSAPFHSSFMESAAKKFREELSKYSFQKLNWSVVSNVDAIEYEDESYIKNMLVKQIVTPVQWQGIVDYFSKKKIDMAIEMGPKTVLKNLLKHDTKNLKVFSYDNEKDVKDLMELDEIKARYAGVEKTIITKCLSAAICTKNLNWENEEYNQGVVETIKKIRKIQEEIKEKDVRPSFDQMNYAIELLKTILYSKKIPLDIQREVLQNIFEETGTEYYFKSYLK